MDDMTEAQRKQAIAVLDTAIRQCDCPSFCLACKNGRDPECYRCRPTTRKP